MPLLIRNARLLTPSAEWSPGWLLCEEQRIARMGYGTAPEFGDVETIDADGLLLLPGFIDLHVHGAMGYEAMDATPEALRCMAQFYARHGVTSFLATTWTDDIEALLNALRTIARCCGPQPEGATILGAHLEGPYLNPAKSGAQNIDQIRRAGRDEALALLDLDVIRLAAVAPEYEENHWFIEECARRGITVSAAHTAATYEQMSQAALRGVSLVTHTFNAMTELHHREPGTVGAALTLPHLRCELIADDVHVHPAAMKVLSAAKGTQGIVLVTDAVRGAGLAEGSTYRQDGRQVTIRSGAAYLAGDVLAGSTLTMDRALVNFMRASGASLEVAWPVTSLNAAQAIHSAHRKGSLDVGKDADFILLDAAVNIHLTVAEGQIVYRDGV